MNRSLIRKAVVLMRQGFSILEVERMLGVPWQTLKELAR